MVVFALSCFGILLFLWKAFGGPSPLAPKRYELTADFSEATQLSDTAEVRISGVTVGRVERTELHGQRTRVTMQIDASYAPLPRDTKAILRQKTLLGETYVEMSPGDPRSGSLPDGGALPRRQVSKTVELDEVTRSLDAPARRDLQQLVRGLAEATGTHGADLSDSLGNLRPFATGSTRLLDVLDAQHSAVRRLVHDSGVVFGALGRRQGELSGLIVSGDRVLSTTARRNRDLATAVRILPTTLAELRATLSEVGTVAGHAGPLVRELRPAARALGPTLVDAAALAPDVHGLFLDLDRVTSVARTALPSLTRVVNAAHPVFRILVPTLQQALPVVQFLGLYKEEVVTTFANLAAATQASERPSAGQPPIHYLRALVPFTSEGAVVNDRRYGTNRHNPYLLPLGLLKLSGGLDSFDCSNTGNPGSGEPAPPCKVQQPLSFQGRRTAYPHVEAAP
ncbi:MAG: phospholipid/cholesterol/gamma-HCH transport system substrate-binding protein [Thermoleophilaceae bacterium]|jgi:virulence factor Mce-like protein|nr:phospholipid/cholesterol/gamma-HCH transport system substrate-binding protein [Thermoleophilaceae bacterium]